MKNAIVYRGVGRQAGGVPRETPHRNLEVHLPSEPYRYPRPPLSPRHVSGKPCATLSGDFDLV